MSDNYKLIEEARPKFSDLWTRMEADERLLHEKYKLLDTQNKEIGGTISVTMNNPNTDINVVSYIISSGKFQWAVEGDIPATMKKKIEDFIKLCFNQAEERLRRRRKNLHRIWSKHICTRGWVGARWLIRKDDNKYIVDCLPIDMHDCVFEDGIDDFNWVAPRFWRSKEQILKEYGEEVVVAGPGAWIDDFWSNEINETFIEGKLSPKGTVKHKLERPPFVIQSAPRGDELNCVDSLSREGESLLHMNRLLYNELNRIVSIEQSLNMQRIMGPVQKEVADFDGPKPEYPVGIGKAIEVKKGELWVPVPQLDINTASLKAGEHIGGALQVGGVNAIDVGNVHQQVSAVWITEQVEIRARLLAPAVEAMQYAYMDSAEMLIDQMIKGGFASELGSRSKREFFKAVDLGDPQKYHVDYKLMTKSKKQEIANITIANAARDQLSRLTILTDILLHDDPEGEIARIDAERAEQADPALFFFRKACSLADEGNKLHGDEADQKKLESMLMTQKGIALLTQPPAPPPETPQGELPEKKNEAQDLVPMLGRGGV